MQLYLIYLQLTFTIPQFKWGDVLGETSVGGAVTTKYSTIQPMQPMQPIQPTQLMQPGMIRCFG